MRVATTDTPTRVPLIDRAYGHRTLHAIHVSGHQLHKPTAAIRSHVSDHRLSPLSPPQDYAPCFGLANSVLSPFVHLSKNPTTDRSIPLADCNGQLPDAPLHPAMSSTST